MTIAGEATSSLGFAPRVVFEGAVDTIVPNTVASEVLATLREALSNVARHAHASRVDIVLEAGAETCLRVVDDGEGVPAELSGSGRGLVNMAQRAEKLGGHFTLSPAQPHGAVLEWCVPCR
jgi:signal transduction histidine kinase